jgi:hypothetical protein
MKIWKENFSFPDVYLGEIRFQEPLASLFGHNLLATSTEGQDWHGLRPQSD